MIPLTRPILDFEDVAEDFREIFETGRLTGGEFVDRFERIVADYVGARYSIATTSATTALHLALVAYRIGRGDEVLVADYTFPASGNTIAQTGARPVLVDCRRGAFDMDMADARSKVTERTRAVMVVDPFGQPADLPAAAQLCDDYGLALIEDAACALGATRSSERCGGGLGGTCFSFHPRKIITTGEGGMITTDDENLAERCRMLRNHGGSPGSFALKFVECGFNYRMSELQAALGCAQMDKIGGLLAGRRLGAERYVERLQGQDWLSIPAAGTTGATFQSFVVLLEDTVDREAAGAALRVRGIETTLGTYAMHAHPAFEAYGYRPGDLPHSHRAQHQSLTLPLWPGMPEADIERVTDALVDAVCRPS